MMLRLAAAALACWSTSALAGGLVFCDRSTDISAAGQDRMLRFSAVVKEELERSGGQVALVARAGTDLSRFGIRYSHAGIALRASPNGAWSVRQLYYACEEGAPRLFDQGLAGFVGGSDDPSIGYLAVLIVPAAEAATLERAALDNRRALALLNDRYSANAYAWGLRYQNCNQWVAELLGQAWGGAEAAGADADADADAETIVADAAVDARGTPAAPRERAQRWLRAHGYAPQRIEVHNPALLLGAAFVPWLHRDDHPEADVARAAYLVSMPDSIEAFVRTAVPGTVRIEFCHAGAQVVVHRGWQPIADGCVAAPGDTVVRLDD